MNLLKGDCLAVLPTIPDASVDLVLLDLPYGQTAAEWDTVIDLAALWTQLKRVGKKNTAYLFFCTTKFGYKLIQSNEAWFRYDIVWQKNNKVGFMNAKKMPMRAHEMIYVFYNKLPVYNFDYDRVIVKTDNKKLHHSECYGIDTHTAIYNRYDKPLWNSVMNAEGGNHVNNCADGVKGKRFHPTFKPHGILELLINLYSNAGQTVLDPTMGSGSTGVACKKLGRNFIGIEMNDTYYETACKRCNDAVANPEYATGVATIGTVSGA